MSSSQYAEIYTYFLRGGYECIVIENILTFIVTGLVLFLILFVFFFVDWTNLLICASSDVCNNFESYIISPYSRDGYTYKVFTTIFIMVFALYYAWIILSLTGELSTFKKYKMILQTDIGIQNVANLEWKTVIDRMVKASSVSPKIIVSSIMQIDNYLIGIIGRDVLKIKKMHYTNTLIWFMTSVLNQILHSNRESRNFYINDNKIRIFLKIVSIIQVLIFPFILIIYTIKIVITLITDVYNNKSESNHRDWSLHSKYTFRDYNELSHIFDERIEETHLYIKMYDEKFNSKMKQIIFSKIIFGLGGYLTLLVIMTLFDDRLLLYIKLFDRNLLWYLTILTSVITMLRSAITKTNTPVKLSGNDIITKLSNLTYHDFIEKYRRSERLVAYDIDNMYNYKFKGILCEFLHLIILPIYILFYINKQTVDEQPDMLDKLIDYIKSNTIYVDGVGFMHENELSEDNEYQFLSGNYKGNRSLEHFENYYTSIDQIDI
jgi:autophagy-related protein 9